VAYLLQLASLHQRHHRYQSVLHYIPGPRNLMADDCSRLWNLTDCELISYFNFTYPQKESWKMLHLKPEMTSALTSSLRKNGPSRGRTFSRSKSPTSMGNLGCVLLLDRCKLGCFEHGRSCPITPSLWSQLAGRTNLSQWQP
jgi:hypothetical protein